MPAMISVKSNLAQVTKYLDASAGKQIKFAAARAVTMLAKEVAADESANMAETFKSPRPFTVKSLGVQGATKANLTARVYVKPITAKYLEPYETGGAHVLPGNALLNPKNVRLDKYGQLPRKTLATLKARPDVFIGPVKTKAGIINGVWQRSYKRANTKVRGTSRKRGAVDRKANTTGHLKLLIRFGDAQAVNKRLHYQARAQRLVDRRFTAVFNEALAYAMATAK